MREVAALSIALLLGALSNTVAAADDAPAVPSDYPRAYSELLDAASREGRVRIYAAADTFDLPSVLQDFGALHRRISVEYVKLHTNDLYRRFTAEVGAGQKSADIVISSAMDLQVRLVNDGYAQVYDSPEKSHVRASAVWKDEAYAVAAEPIVFVYNRTLVPAADVPSTHADFERLLRSKLTTYSRKVASYDPQTSEIGFLYFAQDEQISHDTLDLIEALGHAHPDLSNSGAQILRRVRSGEDLLAYNMNGAYALEQQAAYPSVGVVIPRDYALLMTRIAFISRTAAHPAAAEVLLDYLLSKRGQSAIATHYMWPVRADVPPRGPPVDPVTLRAIHVGPALLADLDQLWRRRFVTQWRKALDE
jgi:iron(III) transport system substrate-binding protein